jgi:type VI secretion system secreted protein Hcp
MALTMYMKVTGKNQGEIKGSCDQGGDKKDKILVYAMDHKVEIPKDTHTGLPT